jgi:hypothetical protein
MTNWANYGKWRHPEKRKEILENWENSKKMNKEQQQIIDEAYELYLNETKIYHYSDSLILSKEEFINKIKTNPEFSETWGLKIEERELSLEERQGILERVSPMYYMDQQFGGEDIFTRNNIPTKLITLTYNNEKIESYE